MNAQDRLELTEMQLELSADSFSHTVDRVTEGIARTQRDIEQAREMYGDDPVKLAQRIQHIVLWAVPNLGMDDLTRVAAEWQIHKHNITAIKMELGA